LFVIYAIDKLEVISGIFQKKIEKENSSVNTIIQEKKNNNYSETSQGISQSEANRKINGDLKYLRNKKVRDKFQRKQEIVINNLTIKNEKEQKEKLLAGLK
jgi:hypothetical protein